MFKEWLEKLYLLDEQSAQRGTVVDEVMNTVSNILQEDMVKYGTSSRLDELFSLIDCKRLPLVLSCCFCTVVHVCSSRIASYDDFVIRLKRDRGYEPEFEDTFRGFRGFKKWGEK